MMQMRLRKKPTVLQTHGSRPVINAIGSMGFRLLIEKPADYRRITKALASVDRIGSPKMLLTWKSLHQEAIRMALG